MEGTLQDVKSLAECDDVSRKTRKIRQWLAKEEDLSVPMQKRMQAQQEVKRLKQNLPSFMPNAYC